MKFKVTSQESQLSVVEMIKVSLMVPVISVIIVKTIIRCGRTFIILNKLKRLQQHKVMESNSYKIKKTL